MEDKYLQMKCYWNINFQTEKDLNGAGEVEGNRSHRALSSDKDPKYSVAAWEEIGNSQF